MKFCCECGAGLSKKIPPGDNLPRFVCDTCRAIHYQNPKIVAGCIPEWEGKILLCRRAIADVEITSLYAVLSLPRISQVHMVFRGTMRSAEFKPGTESLDVQLFALSNIPWDDLAFPVVREALQRYVEDVTRGTFSVHVGSVFPPMKS